MTLSLNRSNAVANGHSVTFCLFSILVFGLASASANATTIAADMDGSSSTNLISHTNPWAGAFSSAGDGFQKYQRGVSSSIPFAIADDSLSIFTGDSLGIIKETNTDEFFGVTDTVNGDTSDPVEAEWIFDISGGSALVLEIDMGAMGDFENSDFFVWEYSIDGGPFMTAFASSVDESAVQDYTLEGGSMFTLSDPMFVNGEILNNDLSTYSTTIVGTGAQLTLRLTAETNGGTEAFAFQTIRIRESAPVAFDMVGSASAGLTSFTNAFNGAFSSAGDGFQKYQRFVSPSIPFAVLDDSLSIFPGDTLGVIREGNTDVFFGIVDTENSNNSGPVSATWVFDISGATELGLSIDMGGMGDFESSDFFIWTYSIDGGPVETAFESTVDEAGSQSYTLEGGGVFNFDDPITIDGEALSNDLATFTAPIAGTGASLSVTLTAQFNGGSETVVFQNLIIGTGFVGPEPPPPPPELEIFEIQGTGFASPFAGEVVQTRDNVVTAVGTREFTIQTPNERADGNIDTSDGILVFTGSAPTVNVGDRVDVLGEVREFFDLTQMTSDPVVNILSTGNPLPTIVDFDASVPSADPMAPSCAIEYECYEGMLVRVVDALVTGPNQGFGSDPIAEVHIVAGGNRPFREPGIEFPGLAGLPVWDGNPEVFELDPNKLGLPNQIINAKARLDAVGVIGYEFGDYEIWPTSLTVRDAEILGPVRDRQRAELTVGSLNMFRLFDDINDPPDTRSDGASRDDTVVSTAEYATRRAKFVNYILNVLKAPDVLAVQEAEKLGVLEDLAADIATADASVVYTAHLIEGNDIGTIDVGFLVRDTVAVDAVTQFNKDEIFDFDGSLLNDRPPLLLEGRSINEGAAYPFAVLNLHGRSLSGITGERVQEKRLAQAQSAATIVQSLQDADPDVRLIVTGDLNAFEFSDGYVDVVGQISGNFDPAASLRSGDDLVEPDLINQVLAVPADERYSFIFGGNAQALDHALTSSALDASIRGFQFGRGNTDAAEILIEDDTTPLASSDHDGLVLFLTKDKDNDGVNDDADVCPMTFIPEMPSKGLGENRFALTDADFDFDTEASNGTGPGRSYSTEDTAGCSCSQIVAEMGLGNGHSKFGCSIGVMDNWVRSVQ